MNLLESIAVIAASIVAVVSFRSWRSSAKWKLRAEVAMEVLLSFYKVRSAFEMIRYPGLSQEEIAPAGSDQPLHDASVTLKRYYNHVDSFNSLRTLRWKYHLIFPNADDAPFEEVEALLRKVLASSNRLGKVVWRRQGKNLPTDEFEKHLHEQTELEAWHWMAVDGSDPLKLRFDEALKTVEKACGKYVS